MRGNYTVSREISKGVNSNREERRGRGREGVETDRRVAEEEMKEGMVCEEGKGEGELVCS